MRGACGLRLARQKSRVEPKIGFMGSLVFYADIARVGHIDEWYLDLAFLLILGRLGCYPVSPLRRVFRDLSAIRPIDRGVFGRG